MYLTRRLLKFHKYKVLLCWTSGDLTQPRLYQGIIRLSSEHAPDL